MVVATNNRPASPEPRPANEVPVVEPTDAHLAPDYQSRDTSIDETADPFAGYEPLPGLEALGRAIVPEQDFYGEKMRVPSGSPANYEELRGCPHPAGWTAFRRLTADRPTSAEDTMAALKDTLLPAVDVDTSE